VSFSTNFLVKSSNLQLNLEETLVIFHTEEMYKVLALNLLLLWYFAIGIKYKYSVSTNLQLVQK